MSYDGHATSSAAAMLAAVRDHTEDRYALAAGFYDAGKGARSRYGRAELSFLRWEIARGVLEPSSSRHPGSPWWRAINDRLLGDKLEAEILCTGNAGAPSARTVELWIEFIEEPSAAHWYRAHNSSIVAGYLEHGGLTGQELPVERFMMNVALVRVLYAHALAADPRLALGWFAPIGRLLGDPRRGLVGFFLDLRRVFPQGYPLEGRELEDLIAAERPLARALDWGIIASRLPELYDFAATALEQPRMAELIDNGKPCYAWPSSLRSAWTRDPGWFLRLLIFATQATGRRKQPPRLRSPGGAIASDESALQSRNGPSV
jgi:hypothetical protein